MKITLSILFFFVASCVYGQVTDTLIQIEQFKRELLSLQADVANIQINLAKSETRFKRGIAVATLGYSITIAGGLMLGRKYDELGKGLLIAGGVTGITGTILMVDAFKFLGRASRKRSP
ncbi:hypothetical protein [Ohtaekwangia koreensis]|uniref:Uncharacterized protein n=1 Tax=Ohtaekwangia koreensis TaxID=688867 RepID=A0A1T5KKG9_9BACT|nr:hypothetical protein [Ohtaekwangia koreensis]SKC63949.1 hypothetical protein SAMN05660236_2276 [Ohtaekwangia koreensis]